MSKDVTKEHFDTTIGSVRSEVGSLRDEVGSLRDEVGSLRDEVGSLRDEFRQELDQCVTKDEFHTRMDEVVTILRRLDQERVFMVEWVKRIESDVGRIKGHLNLA